MKETDIRNPKVLDEYVRMVAEETKQFLSPSEFEHMPCPACGGRGKIEFHKNGFTYVSCTKCGSLYADPRPTQKQLDYFYSKSKANDFFAENFLGPYTEARRDKIFKPRALDVADRFPDIKSYKVGDIGAGTGIFLEELRKIIGDENSQQLCAIEPSHKMAQMCRDKGFFVIESMLEDVKTEDGGFNLLTSFELFEHLRCPEEFLMRVRSLLNDDGYLYLTTLNGGGFDIQLLWEKNDNINPPHHINFRTPAGFKILFERCGYEVISMTTPGKLDWSIVEGRIRDKGIDLGRFWSTLTMADDKVKEGLQEWITESNLSSHIRIIAKKRATQKNK